MIMGEAEVSTVRKEFYSPIPAWIHHIRPPVEG